MSDRFLNTPQIKPLEQLHLRYSNVFIVDFGKVFAQNIWFVKEKFHWFHFFNFAGGLKTRTNKAYIKFISDRSSEKTGFKVSWKAYKRKIKTVTDEVPKKIDERDKALQ